MRTYLVLAVLCLFTAGSVLLLQSCRKNMPATAALAFTVPAGFPQPVYDVAAEGLTEEGFRLGKRLFFDHKLSNDGHISCGSCHLPQAAFTTPDHDRSHGVHNSHTLRNAPGLFNLAWFRNYFQDGAYSNLESVIARHLSHPDEMRSSLDEAARMINMSPEYREQFYFAFGSNRATPELITKALKQYLLLLVSANSKWDQVQRGEAVFTAEEERGAQVFAAKCASCHVPPLFSDFSYRNTGLPLNPELRDFGRMMVTGNRSDSLKFRVPSLRNLSRTDYYGHDGRFSAFRLMIRHYRNGVQPSPTLDPQLSGGIPLTDQQEDDLVRFLFTLTDTGFVNNPRWRQ